MDKKNLFQLLYYLNLGSPATKTTKKRKQKASYFSFSLFGRKNRYKLHNSSHCVYSPSRLYSKIKLWQKFFAEVFTFFENWKSATIEFSYLPEFQHRFSQKKGTYKVTASDLFVPQSTTGWMQKINFYIGYVASLTQSSKIKKPQLLARRQYNRQSIRWKTPTSLKYEK